MRRVLSAWVAMVAAVGPAVSAQPVAGPVQAWVETSTAGGGATFVGRLRSVGPLSARYELTATRQGPSGRSSTRQAGTVKLPAGGEQRLSELGLAPLGPQDRWEVVLKVFQGDALVAVHRVGSPDDA
jgi:hypothetical protein